MQYKVTREKSNTLFVKISSVDRGNWKTDHLGVRLSWKPSCPVQTREPALTSRGDTGQETGRAETKCVPSDPEFLFLGTRAKKGTAGTDTTLVRQGPQGTGPRQKQPPSQLPQKLGRAQMFYNSQTVK